jgi:hypothetical protein
MQDKTQAPQAGEAFGAPDRGIVAQKQLTCNEGADPPPTSPSARAVKIRLRFDPGLGSFARSSMPQVFPHIPSQHLG